MAGTSTRGHRGAVIGGMLAVAAILLGFTQMSMLGPTPTGARLSATSPSPSPSPTRSANPPTLVLDLGETVGTKAVRSCLSPGFAKDPAAVRVLYGVRQRTAGGSSPVMVLRNRRGDVRLCDQFGGDYSSQAPLPAASPRYPVVPLSTGRTQWDCSDDLTLRGLVQTTWLSVTPAVEEVRSRYVVDGVAGPWFSAEPHGGFVHIQAWLHGPVADGVRLGVERQVLDGSGRSVRQTALPTGVQAMPGCPTSGSPEIG